MEGRYFIKLALGGLGFAALSPLLRAGNAFATTAIAKLRNPTTSGKKLLTPAQFDVLREEDTERPFTAHY